MRDNSSQWLRHTLATLAYRAAKTLRGVPPGFGAFAAGPTTRTPALILTHLCDLMDWSIPLADGLHEWHDSQPAGWEADTTRFFEAVARLDQRIAAGGLRCTPEELFQGPVADALTHVGQIALLRRLAGEPVRGENYFKADIAAGRVGTEQSAPRREFGDPQA
jgi:hypothetical protein